MRLAITGTSGRVGRALADRLAPRHEVIELPRRCFDLEEAGVAGKLDELDFEVLLNPAALTSLEACEDHPELARRVNSEAPGELARWCEENGRRMVHFSTDYVFGGEAPGLRGERESVAPQSVYGRSKEAGERAVLERGACVLRVSWVFGPEKPAFPDSVIAKALDGQPLAAVADKWSLPAFTADLAEWVEAVIADGGRSGVVHACQSGEPVSWHGMAGEIVECLEQLGALESKPGVKPLRLDEMTAFRAVRPRHTAMATPTLARILGRPPRSWREALREHVGASLIGR